MDKPRFDPRNPDPGILRQAVFARLRAGWRRVENADFNGQHLVEGFGGVVEFLDPIPPVPGGWQQGFLEAVYNLLWELVREGVIRPGNASGLDFPFLSITEYGRRVLTSENAHPHDVERFLDRLKRGQPIDSTVEAYVIESLHSFRQDRLVSSSILLGVAAERTFIIICDALLAALSDPKQSADFKRRLDRQPMKPKLEWAHSKLLEFDSRRKQLPDYPESAPLMITGIYDLIRHQRNDLGHPRDLPPRLDRARVESHLTLFSEYYRGAEELRAFLVGHKSTL